ncbi:MAG: type II toxin-antitoxin system RelE/ParE family toxin [Ferruginibacter sp.]
MTFKLEIKEEAKKDILAATKWYAEKQDGLNKRFIEQLENVLQVIVSNPKTYKKVYKQFRQAALKKFPYVVLYEIELETIIIYSVFQARQNPRKKIRRLKN